MRAIIGTPGSGKSVWMNEIAWSYRATNAQVRLLDLGRSFEKLCRKANGQFVEFGPHSPINVNPFTVVDDIDRDMAMLTPVIAKMASLSAPLEEVQYKAINAGILRVWRAHGKDMTITALRDLFKTGTLEDLEIHNDIAHQGSRHHARALHARWPVRALLRRARRTSTSRTTSW